MLPLGASEVAAVAGATYVIVERLVGEDVIGEGLLVLAIGTSDV